MLPHDSPRVARTATAPPRRNPRETRPSYRPRLEVLEGRAVPSVTMIKDINDETLDLPPNCL